MKKNLFIPDQIFNDIYEITPEYLISENVRFVLSDIDNTLVTYSDKEPTEKLLVWLRSLDEAGIKTAFISNNNKNRVSRFNKDLRYPAYHGSGKPSRRFVFRLMEEMGAEKENTCIIGDQIFTDVLSAKRAGIRAILVQSIEPPKDLFGKIKKALEKKYVAEYYKKRNGP